MAKAGIWNNPGEKIIPGVYSKFLAAYGKYEANLVGTMGIIVKANWGEPNKVVTVKNDINEFIDLFGDDMESKYSAFKLCRLMFETNIAYLKVYRMCDSSAAVSKLKLKNANHSSTDIIELATKYPTAKDFNVTIKNSLAGEKTVDMFIYEGKKLKARIYNIKGKVDEMVDIINNAYENKYVIAKKLEESTDQLAEIQNEKLTGGNDGTGSITNKNYTDAFPLFEREKIDGFALDGKEDEALDASAFEWIKANYKDGRTIQYFSGIGKSQHLNEAFGKAKKINNMLYTLVGSSGMVDDLEYTPAETASYLCAKEISCKLKESCCNENTVFTNVKTVFTNAELEEAMKVGVMVLDLDEDNNVVIVDDVNTYKTYPDGNPNERVFAYNRSVRTVSAINKMLKTAGKGIIGKVNNDEKIGHDIIISEFKKGFEYLVQEGALKSFDVRKNEKLQATALSDELYIDWTVERMDKVKKIYNTGVIR